MTPGPEPRAGISDIEAYVPGHASAAGGGKVYKLSSNETPLGPSRAAIAAYGARADTLHLYPDGGANALRAALAKHHGLNPEHIVCGAGSDELLQLLAHAYLGPGDEAVYCRYGFTVYPIVIRANGATPVIAEETDFQATPEAILARVNDRTRMVFLANPNNPTGTYMNFEDVKRLRAGLPEACMLVLDAAYAEYVGRNDYSSGMELVSNSLNTVMTRTFSKIYGLAALRLGWAYCPAAVADVLNRVRGPFNVNAPALAAGVAALADSAHVQAAIDHNERWLPWLRDELSELGLEVTDSVGNFLLIHFSGKNAKTATSADAFLVRRGLILRTMAVYGLPNALRLTVGSEQANRAVVSAMGEFLHGAG